MPGTVTPEPVPFEQVTEQAQPSPSSTEMWVVEPSRSATAARYRVGVLPGRQRRGDLAARRAAPSPCGEVGQRAGRAGSRPRSAAGW